MIDTQIRPLSEQTFNLFRDLIYEKTNINMRDSKHILVSNRLRKRIVALGLCGYDEYYNYLTKGENRDKELPHFIDAVSTNETYFFREMNHFGALGELILPELFGFKKQIRIWCAGCSSGEEPYTLRIVVDEYFDRAGTGKAEIIATDISTDMIEKARNGVYGERAIRFVPEEVMKRFFFPVGGGCYQITPELKSGVDFRVHNLLKEDPPENSFDLIFCRNVMIYFDKAIQRRLVDEYFAEVLDPRGYLCIGHSESLTGTSQRFRYLRGIKAPIYKLE
ncbi:MAG: protein-glutamate O-methyltransferase CheR [Spirochaetaceae bacterium]|nr:MAG: protein-glutamate O-methyltransferase CheR [Spirochaetaceae bacterium]